MIIQGEKMNLFENLFKFKIDNQDVVGLNDELKCIYIWNLFSNSNDSILFVVNSLYEARVFHSLLIAPYGIEINMGR